MAQTYQTSTLVGGVVESSWSPTDQSSDGARPNAISLGTLTLLSQSLVCSLCSLTLCSYLHTLAGVPSTADMRRTFWLSLPKLDPSIITVVLAPLFNMSTFVIVGGPYEKVIGAVLVAGLSLCIEQFRSLRQQSLYAHAQKVL